MKKFVLSSAVLAFFLSSLHNPDDAPDITENPEVDKELLISRHNFYRQKVGAPDIKWSDELAAYAQVWAEKIAKTCELQHSGGKYGENIYWTSSTADAGKVVDYWAEEEQYFNHKNTTYVRGKSNKSGHYSQIIWAKSTEVGCGAANCKGGGQIWVCSYNPAGNYIGEKAY